MNPFFFGNSKAPLYGVYHQSDQPSAKHGVVLCAAFGQEYMRSHRAMRQLATMLSRVGVPVLRFDYRGTGDSAGDIEETTAQEWLEDLNLAIDELKDTANLQSVSVIGLRLGCLVATHVCKSRADITKLTLWDPIVSGTDYIAELTSEIKSQPQNKRSNFIAPDGTLHYNGFAINQELQNSLNALNLLNSYPENVPEVVQIISHNNERFTSLQKAWNEYSSFTCHKIDAPGDWNYVDDNGGILLPQPIIQGIVNQYKMREAA